MATHSQPPGAHRMAIQHGDTNTATGDDVVGVQVGRISPSDASDDQTPAAPPGDAPGGRGRTVHIVSGNAHVGMQTNDVVVGNITISMVRGRDTSWWQTDSPGTRRSDADADEA